MCRGRWCGLVMALWLWPVAGGAFDLPGNQMPGASAESADSSEGTTPSSAPARRKPTEKKTIYQWIDDEGVVHFVEDPGLIPPRYRDRVRERKIDTGEGASGTQRWWTAPPETTDSEETGAPNTDDPAYWRARQEQLVRRYRALHAAWERISLQIPVAIKTGAPPARLAALRKERARLAAELRRLAAELRDLPDQITAAGGNEQWVEPWEALGLPEPPGE